MIGSINSFRPAVSNVSFMGLPQYLQRAKLESINVRGLTDIIRDAGRKAGVVLDKKVTPKTVREHNPKLFDEAGRMTSCGVALLAQEYELKDLTCVALRDALAKSYKKYADFGGIYDMLV